MAKLFEFDQMKAGDIYRLMIDVIVPRPIAWISTMSPEGVANLAPFSFFNGVGNDPPSISVAFANKRDGSPKDTLRNIQETGEFVVHTVSRSHLAPMHQTSAERPYGASELEEIGMKTLTSLRVAPPRLADAMVALECRKLQVVEVGKGRLLIGEVLVAHVADSVWTGQRVDVRVLDPISRLGGHDYGGYGEPLELPPAR